jgi:uncharacterized protein YndB with AHSA1/START domain
MVASAASKIVASEDFVISRVVDAPRDLVWRSWTEVERLKQWWGPKGVKVFHATLDLRPGGTFHYGLRTPDGFEMWGKFVYREISAPNRLVFASSFADADGNVARAPFFDGKWPLQIMSTVTFAERNGKTEVSVRWAPDQATAAELATFVGARDSMQQGWSGTFEQLNDYLAKA